MEDISHHLELAILYSLTLFRHSFCLACVPGASSTKYAPLTSSFQDSLPCVVPTGEGGGGKEKLRMHVLFPLQVLAF